MTISAITPKGQVLAFDPILRPVMALRSGRTRGSVLDRVMREDGEEKPAEPGLARLSAYDVEQVDRGLLSAGLAQAKTLHGEGRTPMLFAPAAFATLASPRGRRDVVEMLTDAQRRLNARLVLEITHLDAGLPPSRLVEVLSLMRPLCRVVFARIKVERRAIAALTDCTLAGAAVEAAHIADPEDADLLTRVRLVLAGIGPRMLLHNLRTTAAIHAAHEAGISYASLDLSHMTGAMPAWSDSDGGQNKSGGEVTPAAA
jgi:hypothetical protein